MSDLVPHDCPVCNFMLRDMQDVISYEEFKCCTDCQNQFVFRNLNAWLSGSRPSSEEISKYREQMMTHTTYLAV